MDRLDVSATLRRVRRISGLSMTQVARRGGPSLSAISRGEQPHQNAPVDRFVRTLNACGARVVVVCPDGKRIEIGEARELPDALTQETELVHAIK